VLDYAGGGPIEICSGVTGAFLLPLLPSPSFQLPSLFSPLYNGEKGDIDSESQKAKTKKRKLTTSLLPLAGLVYSLFLGKRRGFGTHILSFKPHNVSFVIQGTIFLWVGWIGFNGGSTFAANVKAAVAITNTNLAAGCGGLCWLLLDWRLERKWSAVGYCTGAICGLVAIVRPFPFVLSPSYTDASSSHRHQRQDS
jgi:ammonia channel protein AmtB